MSQKVNIFHRQIQPQSFSNGEKPDQWNLVLIVHCEITFEERLHYREEDMYDATKPIACSLLE